MKRQVCCIWHRGDGFEGPRGNFERGSGKVAGDLGEGMNVVLFVWMIGHVV